MGSTPRARNMDDKKYAIVELDQRELAIRIHEAFIHANRPLNMEAKKALEMLSPELQDRLIDAALAATQFFVEQLQKSQTHNIN